MKMIETNFMMKNNNKMPQKYIKALCNILS